MGVVGRSNLAGLLLNRGKLDVSHVGSDKGLEKSKPRLVPWGYAKKD